MNSPRLLVNDLEDELTRKRSAGFLWTLFTWTLGLVEWVEPRSDTAGRKVEVIVERSISQRRALFVSSIIFLLVLTAGSIFTVTWFLLCLFRNHGQFLWFGSFSLFYWPIIFSPLVICLYATVKNHLTRRSRRTFHLSWTNIFSETYFASRCSRLEVPRRSWICPRYSPCYFAFFLSFAAANSTLEILHLIDIGQGQGCQTWPRYICTCANISSLFFYAVFCYFLYLTRISAERESEETMAYVRSNSVDVKACKVHLSRFFGAYIQLRGLVFPWLNTIIFCTSFGMAILFTLNTDDLKRSMTWIPVDPDEGANSTTWWTVGDRQGMTCGVSCTSNSTTRGQWKNGYLIFNMMLFGEKVMVVTLALMVAGAMDLSYIWNRFKMHLTVLPVDTVRNRDRFVEYVRFMHPDPTSATIASFVVPLLGIACGTLSGKRLELG